MASLRNLIHLVSVGCLGVCGQQDATIAANDASTVVFHHNNGGEPGTLDPPSKHFVKPYVKGYQPNIMGYIRTRQLRVERN